MENRITHYQQDLNQSFVTMLNNLGNLKKLTEAEIQDEKIQKSLQKMNSTISSSIEKVEQKVRELQTDIEFERYNVAFFGETNAGKSTLIEAIINGSGDTIGDGSKDFTKETTVIKLKNINLLDLPGMEGNESKYIEEIKKGINKAHTIIYVSSSDKEPEESTLEKIKSYLKNQTNIYSIVNIRLPLNSTTAEFPLIDDNMQLVVDRTEEKFKRIFGSHFKKTLAINANIGYICRSSNREEKLEKKKNKMIKLLGSQDAVYKYSNFESLNRIIKTLNNNDSLFQEIAVANTYKFFSVNENIVSDTLKSKKDLDFQLKKILLEVEDLNNVVIREKNTFDKNIKNNVKKQLKNLKNQLNEVIDAAVTYGYSEAEVEIKMKEAIKDMNASLKNDINIQAKIFNDKLNLHYKEMNQQIKLNVRFTDFSSDLIDMGNLFDDFSAGLKEVFKTIISVITAVVFAIGGGLFAMIGAGIVVLASRLFKWNIAGKKQAQRKKVQGASAELENRLQEIEKELERELTKRLDETEKTIIKQTKRIEHHVANIKKLSFKMTNQISKLTRLKVEASKSLLEFVEAKTIDYAYFDYGMKSLFVIGGLIKDKKLYNLKYIEGYTDYKDFFEKNNYRIDKKFIYFNSHEEFQKRAVSELINFLKSNDRSIPIIGVRKNENIKRL